MSDHGSERNAAHPHARDATAARLVEQGRAHHRAGRLEQAAAAYAEALERGPRAADILHRLGAVRHQQGRQADALTLLDEAVGITPDDAMLHNTLGSVLLASGRVEEAAAAFARAAHGVESEAGGDGFAEAYYNLGAASQVLERLDQAEAAYRRAIELSPAMVEAHTNLGVVLRARGDPAAVQCFHRAIELEPRFAAAHLNLGLALAHERRWPEALASLEHTVALRPELGEAWYQAGLALRALGRPGDAGDRFQRASELLPHFVPAHEALLEELERVGSADASAARVNLGTALLAAGRVREALAQFDAVISRVRENTRAVAHKWVALTALAEHDAAGELVDFERFLEAAPLPCPSRFASIAELNAALAAHVLGHPSLRADPQDNATRGGLHSGSLLAAPRGPVDDLAAAIDAAVADYRARLPGASDHPFIASAPARWKLDVWAVVLEAQGHQEPHLHPDGWLSGVYYVQVPAAVGRGSDDAGWIEFGDPSSDFPVVVTPRDRRRIRPEEGLLVLFPSYFYHRTIPFEGAGRRISIAFDVRRAG